MPGRMMWAIAIGALCLAHAALALAGERPYRARAADRDPYTDPAAPYKANRLQSKPGVPRLDAPGQSTVLTRHVLDDMNATSVRDAMRSTAGVTVGR